MFNVGGGELVVILLVALIVLGPDKLPETARKIGNVMGEVRRMSMGFQNEMRAAMDDVTRTPAPKPNLEPVSDSKPVTDDSKPATDGAAAPEARASDDPAA